MIRWPELNRHTVGIPALVLLIAGIGLLGNMWTGLEPRQRIAQVDKPAPTNPTPSVSASADRLSPWDTNFLTESRSASRGVETPAPVATSTEPQRQEATSPKDQSAEAVEPRASNTSQAPSVGRGLAMAASAWKDWSDQDWQVAIKAVDESHSGARAQSAQPEMKSPAQDQVEHRSASKEPLVWQPPAEIASKSSGASQR
jgi:hypothetical protein